MRTLISILIVTAVIGGGVGGRYIAAAERDPNRLWCAEHGVYEDECHICHPELAKQSAQADNGPSGRSGEPTTERRDPARLWCGEHGLYEDECLICHPELAGKPTGNASTTGELWCNEHGVAERECGICQPGLLEDLPVGQGLKVRFPSEASIEKAGVRLGTPSFSTGVPVPVLGEILYNRNAFANVTPLGAGVITDVLVDVGERVAPDQLLATISSPAVAEGKSAYLKALAVAELARQVYAREKDLHTRKISARQDYETAQATLTGAQSDVEYARQNLMNLGLTKAEVDEVARTGSTDSKLPVRAPFAGTVLDRRSFDDVDEAVHPGDAAARIGGGRADSGPI